MKKNIASLALVLCSTLLFPAPSDAADASPDVASLLEENEELMNLYFDPEDLVETATRSPKPLNQVAENVTIITAEQIERMNAHSVDDVLNRVAGIMVEYQGQDFNGNSALMIHDSDYEHVTVLVDGIRINKIWAEIAFTNVIPIRIIKRIEVIKGAASSTWGAGLGGVINIITKDTGKTDRITGSLHASYGEFATSDVTGEAAGKIGGLGYYVSAGRQDSDGLNDDRYFENRTIYGKFDYRLPANTLLTVTASSSRPEYRSSWRPPEQGGRQEELDDENLYYSANLDTQFGPRMSGHLLLYTFKNDYTYDRSTVPGGVSYLNDNGEQTTKGVNGRFNFRTDNHNLVAGVDYQRNELILRDLLIDYEADPVYEETWGLYVNDTITLGNFSLTPGLRYEAISITDDMLNPSLGLTWQVGEKTLLRAIAARGFRKVPPAFVEGDLYFMWELNPDLEPEKTWSYQFGLESAALPFGTLKTTLFYHRATDVWTTWTWPYTNGGSATRRGFECELVTNRFHDTWLTANFTYTRHETQLDETGYSRLANLIVTYDNPELATLELAGHYVHFGSLHSPDSVNGRDDNFIWDLNVNKRIYKSDSLSCQLFGVLHNVFDEEQYYREIFPNAPRWFEAGMKIFF